jgi:hypothetical protein
LPKPYLLDLAAALTLAALVVLSLSLAPTTLASTLGSPSENPRKFTIPKEPEDKPPRFALMKGNTVIQKGLKGNTCWYYWVEIEDREAEAEEAREGYWTGYCADVLMWRSPRRAVLVHPGSALHIRIYKPERPDRLSLDAHPGYDPIPWDKSLGNPVGKHQSLTTTLSRVERDDKTVAWDVFFRVREPDRHYYLGIWADWERVPGTHISHGDRGWFFHVKTR